MHLKNALEEGCMFAHLSLVICHLLLHHLKCCGCLVTDMKCAIVAGECCATCPASPASGIEVLANNLHKNEHK